MKLKGIIASLLSAAIVSSFVGCSSSDSTPTFGTVKTYDSNTYTNTDSQHTTNTLANTISPANLDEVNDDVSTSPINNYNAEDDIESTKTSGGAPQVLNCGNICGGAAFDTRITV